MLELQLDRVYVIGAASFWWERIQQSQHDEAALERKRREIELRLNMELLWAVVASPPEAQRLELAG